MLYHVDYPGSESPSSRHVKLFQHMNRLISHVTNIERNNIQKCSDSKDGSESYASGVNIHLHRKNYR